MAATLTLGSAIDSNWLNTNTTVAGSWGIPVDRVRVGKTVVDTSALYVSKEDRIAVMGVRARLIPASMRSTCLPRSRKHSSLRSRRRVATWLTRLDGSVLILDLTVCAEKIASSEFAMQRQHIDDGHDIEVPVQRCLVAVDPAKGSSGTNVLGGGSSLAEREYGRETRRSTAWNAFHVECLLVRTLSQPTVLTSTGCYTTQMRNSSSELQASRAPSTQEGKLRRAV